MKAKLKLFAFILFALSVVLRLEAGQTPQFVTIYEFGGVNAIPSAELTLGPSGQLFGTTYGGADADGTGSIYELVPNGSSGFTFNTLYRFDTAYSPANDGQYPYAGLTLSPDGTTLYGTTQQGGTDGSGVLFSLNIASAETGSSVVAKYGNDDSYEDLWWITSATGSGSHSTGTDFGDFVAGALYLFGTLSHNNPGDHGSVYVFSLGSSDTNGSALIIFDGLHGSQPQGKLAASTTSAAPGLVPVKANAKTKLDLSTITLYGITKSGGSNNWGTVYSVNANGSNFMVLHHFNYSTTDGAGPLGGMVLSGNTLYGTTSLGGNNYAGTVFKINTDGSGFQIIKNFDYATTGYTPEGDLILSGNTLYGTTYAGGVNGGGTVYSIDTSGSNFMVLHSFTTPVSDGNGHYTNSDGGFSVAGLLLSGYTLYGTTPYGGTNGVGTAYEIILPAPPSLKIAPTVGGVKISWPSSATNYVLLKNSNLATTNWSTNSLAVSNDGTNQSVTIVPTTGNVFFRLMNTNSP
jgi:uncharacterized repeat protein (TIGR03803 family)